MPEKNVDLMLQVRDQITSHPETHFQGMFERDHHVLDNGSCGTTRCIAGWAIFFATGNTVQKECFAWPPLSQMEKHPEGMGAKLLGLTDDEAHKLFYQMDEHKALELLDEYIEKGKNGE